MENLMIYPFDIESSPIVRHKKLLTKYNIKLLVSPHGWGMTNQDASITDNGEKINIKINDNFEENIKYVDTVLFVDSNIKLGLEEVLYPKILMAISVGKNIICSIKLEDNIKKEFFQKCSKKGLRFEYIGSDENYNMELKNTDNLLYDINSPVVFVCGNDERTDKYEIQLVLREHLLNEGYTISQIGTKNYSNLMGFHSFPHFMYENLLSESDKIILFNHYIKSIELTEKPDLIIIGIPFGIMPFNKRFNNNFGIMLYEISNAINPDYTIFSNTYRDYSIEQLDEISDVLRCKFGIDIDCFNISNTRIDWNNSELYDEKVYTKILSKHIDKKISLIKDNNIPIINILNSKHSEFLCKHLIDNLSDNSRVKLM